jgi:hypothetical protein
MNGPALTGEFIRDGVDQEWHVIGHDAHHGSGIPRRRKNTDQGLTCRSDLRELKKLTHVLDYSSG